MEYVRELIRRMRIKDNEHYLPLDQEIEFVRNILSNSNYLTSEFCKLYGERFNQIGWLNEYSLDDSLEKEREEATLKELSEIEACDKIIEELSAQLEEKNKTIEEMTSKNNEANKDIEQFTTQTGELRANIEKLNSEVSEKGSKIEEITKANEEKKAKIKELEELNEKQTESFNNFKKTVSEQLRIIETMMKKDMTQINKIEMEHGNESMEGLEDTQEEENKKDVENETIENFANLENEIGNVVDPTLNDTYKKVENYVKRLLEELKKSKEQNYIYKSQIAQNDKINAILNEKIYQYSENACKESNSGVTLKGKANSKTNLSQKKAKN
jgi:chromosome segregation ATPase